MKSGRPPRPCCHSCGAVTLLESERRAVRVLSEAPRGLAMADIAQGAEVSARAVSRIVYGNRRWFEALRVVGQTQIWALSAEGLRVLKNVKGEE